jgi:hypothetical protein
VAAANIPVSVAPSTHWLSLLPLALAGLVADCRKCCVKAEEDTIKYTSAILEVCPYRLK